MLYSRFSLVIYFIHSINSVWALPSRGGSAVKNLPAVQRTQESHVQSLDREGLLEKGMATHSSILAGIIPLTEESGGLQSTGSQRVRHD